MSASFFSASYLFRNLSLPAYASQFPVSIVLWSIATLRDKKLVFSPLYPHCTSLWLCRNPIITLAAVPRELEISFHSSLISTCWWMHSESKSVSQLRNRLAVSVITAFRWSSLLYKYEGVSSLQQDSGLSRCEDLGAFVCLKHWRHIFSPSQYIRFSYSHVDLSLSSFEHISLWKLNLSTVGSQISPFATQTALLRKFVTKSEVCICSFFQRQYLSVISIFTDCNRVTQLLLQVTVTLTLYWLRLETIVMYMKRYKYLHTYIYECTETAMNWKLQQNRMECGQKCIYVYVYVLYFS